MPISKNSLKRNTIYNLCGSMLPLLVSIITVPLYLKLIGDARYGVMAVVWILLGYFGVFDLGLSRATANHVAKTHNSPPEEREAVFWTGIWLNSFFGIVGGLLLYLVASPLLAYVFKMPEALRGEILVVLPWVAASVPIATISGVLTGTLEGRERFLALNILQLLGTVLFQIVPLLSVLVWGPQLSVLIPATVLARGTSALLLTIAAIRILPISCIRLPNKLWIKKLLGYGAWVSVTSLISPLLETLDRMMIGSVLGAQSVAHYSVPFSLVDKVRMIPIALGRTLFPRMSQLTAHEATALGEQSVRLICATMTLLIAPAMLLIGPFLQIWVGADFAQHSTPVAQIILLGIWANAPAFVPLILLQSQGRPDLVAKFHTMEFLPFIGFLWVSLHTMGLVGAALAWSVRVTVDAALLFWGARLTWRSLFSAAGIVLLSWLVAWYGQPRLLPALFLAVVFTLVAAFWCWRAVPEISTLFKQWRLRQMDTK